MDIYPNGKNSDDPGMKREETRRENARLLAREAGSLTAFAKTTDMSDSQVNQLIGKNPVKNIGNIVAARIEQAYGKPGGWLDQDHSRENSIPNIADEVDITTSEDISREWPFTVSLQEILEIGPEEKASLDKYISYTVKEWQLSKTEGNAKKESAIDKHTDNMLRVKSKKHVG